MKKIKKFLSSLIAIMIVATMVTSNLSALEVNSSFVQNTNTSNTYGYVNYETDQLMDEFLEFFAEKLKGKTVNERTEE